MTKESDLVLAKNARNTIVVPALHRIGLYSLAAEKLLMGTGAIESFFTWTRQFGGGPGVGLFQMGKYTFDDLTNRFLAEPRNTKLRSAVFTFSHGKNPGPMFLIHNPCFAAAMARVKYYSIPEPIPLTVNGQAHYWKKYYNGNSKHGRSVQDYINRWNELCAPLYDAKPAALQSASPMSQSLPLQAPIWV